MLRAVLWRFSRRNRKKYKGKTISQFGISRQRVAPSLFVAQMKIRATSLFVLTSACAFVRISPEQAFSSSRLYADQALQIFSAPLCSSFGKTEPMPVGLTIFNADLRRDPRPPSTTAIVVGRQKRSRRRSLRKILAGSLRSPTPRETPGLLASFSETADETPARNSNFSPLSSVWMDRLVRNSRMSRVFLPLNTEPGPNVVFLFDNQKLPIRSPS